MRGNETNCKQFDLRIKRLPGFPKKNSISGINGNVIFHLEIQYRIEKMSLNLNSE